MLAVYLFMMKKLNCKKKPELRDKQFRHYETGKLSVIHNNLCIQGLVTAAAHKSFGIYGINFTGG